MMMMMGKSLRMAWKGGSGRASCPACLGLDDLMNSFCRLISFETADVKLFVSFVSCRGKEEK